LDGIGGKLPRNQGKGKKDDRVLTKDRELLNFFDSGKGGKGDTIKNKIGQKLPGNQGKGGKGDTILDGIGGKLPRNQGKGKKGDRVLRGRI